MLADILSVPTKMFSFQIHPIFWKNEKTFCQKPVFLFFCKNNFIRKNAPPLKSKRKVEDTCTMYITLLSIIYYHIFYDIFKMTWSSLFYNLKIVIIDLFYKRSVYHKYIHILTLKFILYIIFATSFEEAIFVV